MDVPQNQNPQGGFLSSLRDPTDKVGLSLPISFSHGFIATDCQQKFVETAPDGQPAGFAISCTQQMSSQSRQFSSDRTSFLHPAGKCGVFLEYSLAALIPNEMSPGTFMHSEMTLSALKNHRKSLQTRALLDFC